MKHGNLIIILSACVLAALCGCGESVRTSIEGGSSDFPSKLAGVWVNEEQGWRIVLDPNGIIPEMTIPMGRTELEAGKETQFEIPQFEGKAIYRPGQWKVAYEPKTRQLSITVELEYFYHDVGNHAIEGSTIDYLAGQVSKDGLTWRPVLKSSGFVDALMFEGWTLKERKNLYDYPYDDPVYRGEVVFTKQSPNAVSKAVSPVSSERSGTLNIP